MPGVKTRGELYNNIVDLIRFKDMQKIKAEMRKRYGVEKVDLLTIEQLNEWIGVLMLMLHKKEL